MVLKIVIAVIVFAILLMWGLEHVWIAFDKHKTGESWHALMTIGLLYVVADFVFLLKCVLPLMD